MRLIPKTQILALIVLFCVGCVELRPKGQFLRNYAPVDTPARVINKLGDPLASDYVWFGKLESNTYYSDFEPTELWLREEAARHGADAIQYEHIVDRTRRLEDVHLEIDLYRKFELDLYRKLPRKAARLRQERAKKEAERAK